jgi:hypothetical protein
MEESDLDEEVSEANITVIKGRKYHLPRVAQRVLPNKTKQLFLDFSSGQNKEIRRTFPSKEVLAHVLCKSTAQAAQSEKPEQVYHTCLPSALVTVGMLLQEYLNGRIRELAVVETDHKEKKKKLLQDTIHTDKSIEPEKNPTLTHNTKAKNESKEREAVAKSKSDSTHTVPKKRSQSTQAQAQTPSRPTQTNTNRNSERVDVNSNTRSETEKITAQNESIHSRRSRVTTSESRSRPESSSSPKPTSSRGKKRLHDEDDSDHEQPTKVNDKPKQQKAARTSSTSTPTSTRNVSAPSQSQPSHSRIQQDIETEPKIATTRGPQKTPSTQPPGHVSSSLLGVKWKSIFDD